MRSTWRWFGPQDRVLTDDILQAGAQGVVTALHHVPYGDIWSPQEIARRQKEVATLKDGSDSRLSWEVVESLPVSEDIKQQTGNWRAHMEAYKISLQNIAKAGIQVICYNFMPILDWTRTDLKWRLPNGVTCMRFDLIDFALYDIHLLNRPGAAEAFPPETAAAAAERLAQMSAASKAVLCGNVVCGLPGETTALGLDDVRGLLRQYHGINADRLRQHLIDFLTEMVPVCEALGLRLCCHPDDPPFPLLGLPRVMSTEADYRLIMQQVDSPSNGITLCSGSLGVRADNDLPGMMTRLGDRVHFLHLRNVRSESPQPGDVPARLHSFHESEHMDGNTDMVALLDAVRKEELRRRSAGRSDWQIPMRADHGQDMYEDSLLDAQPGYPKIGRMKGLAELKAAMRVLEHRGERAGQ
ncbi:MAG: mannonate dehydratase [Rhizobiaceae bacterium]|nr:mannonate dehydratase [Rhizobiaceae bacterium]